MDDKKLGTKIVEAEGFDFKQLKGVIKEFNDAKILKENVKFVGLSKEKIVMAFMHGIEDVPEDADDSIPTRVVSVYNSFADILEGRKKTITCFDEEPEEEIDEEPEEEIDEEPKTKPVKKSKKKTTEKPIEKPKKETKKKEPRQDSRPGVLFAAMKKGKTLEQLLKNQTILEKYDDHIVWIKSDFARLEGLLS